MSCQWGGQSKNVFITWSAGPALLKVTDSSIWESDLAEVVAGNGVTCLQVNAMLLSLPVCGNLSLEERKLKILLWQTTAHIVRKMLWRRQFVWWLPVETQERMGWTNIVIKIKIGCAVHMVQEGLVDYCQVMNFYDSKNVHVVNLIVVLGSLILLF